MAANVINSPLAIQMSVFVVRAFIRLREMVSTHRELSRRLAELEKRLGSHDEQIQLILKAMRQLMAAPEKQPKKIGFQLREKRAAYGKRLELPKQSLAFFAPLRLGVRGGFGCVFYLWTLSPGLGNHE